MIGRIIDTMPAAVSRCHDWPRVPVSLELLGDRRVLTAVKISATR